jgi:predicted GNAT family acetyltransferase
MEIITVHPGNIDREHICCAISDQKGETYVSSKKAWMKERFPEGLVFKKLNVQGKVFIEYIPAEKAWSPILADGYMHIHCFWVSGQFKGQGHANRLLEECLADARAKGKHGLTALSSVKKLPFLSDPAYLKYKGFRAADTAPPSYELLYLPFEESAPVPQFGDCVKQGGISEPGMVLYYSNQCPYTEKYSPMIRQIAQRHGATITIHKIGTTEQARHAPAPFTTYSFFYNGNFVTNEIFSEKKFEKFLQEHGM